MESFEELLGPAICGVVGAGLAAFGFYRRGKLRASESWAQTVGKIQNATTVEKSDGESRNFEVAVRYWYAADGQHYQGTQVMFGARSYASRKQAEASCGRYVPDTSVNVYFDPSNPQEAVLEREAPYSMLYLTLGVGLAVFAVGMSLWMVMRGS